MQLEKTVSSLEAMLEFGRQIGTLVKGGEIFELVGDVGTGKTSFVKGLAKGLGITEVVQSPTFTISRLYDARDGLGLHHYDFYRLKEAGIMRAELAESLQDTSVVVALEWDETVRDLLPPDKTVRLTISYTGENDRLVAIDLPAELQYLQPATKGAI